MQNVLGLILGGGRGTRLYPLTQKRSEPAVPLAGKYRLIDIPISNCLHAGIEKISILTQFNSVSLHRHIYSTYVRDMFSGGWVEVLAAQQTLGNETWYQGTADAVRQQLREILSARTDYVLILAGDHLYQMDYRKFVRYHIETEADITLAVQPVEPQFAPGFGILKCDSTGQIVEYREKPAPKELDGLESMPGTQKPFMASMGIYVITTQLLKKLLASPGNDFGKDIIPRAMPNCRVMGYVFDGYWADIGTIRRFYEVNLEMASPNPPFNLSNPDWFVYTHPRFLPPCEVYGATLEETLLTDGCRIYNAAINKAVIGLRSIIGPNASIQASVLMGADYYENAEELAENRRLGRPDVGIGEGTQIEGALIDKNARIGKHVQIRHVPNRPDSEGDNWVARDGLVIIPKNAIIPDGTVI
jgi:glucose-1-phosphate adenylyltransferase